MKDIGAEEMVGDAVGSRLKEGAADGIELTDGSTDGVSVTRVGCRLTVGAVETDGAALGIAEGTILGK